MRKRFIALLVLLCAALALLRVDVLGVGVVEVKYQNDDPGTGIRVGLKSIVIDDVTYYDIYNGDPGVRIAPNQSIQFIKDVLTKPDNTMPGEVTVLDYWSQLAYRIFNDNSSYASHINADGGFEANFGRRGGATDGGYADLVKDLQSLTSGSRSNTGSNSSDNTTWTGLSYASSLKDVRQRMANSIASGIGRKISGQQVLNNTNGGDALEMLDEDTTGDVFYSIVTGVDRAGSTFQYYYNSFGIAFYDFQLSVIADDALQYITAAEGYGSVQEAAANQAPGVTYEVIGNNSGVLSYYENSAAIPSEVGMEFTQSNSTEISNSMTSTETYTFKETIGSETKISAAVPLLGGVDETIKLEFSAEQAFSTAWTNTKTVKQETSNQVSASLNLPAHSAVSINTADGTVKVTLQYDGPVAISYKVAMFALNGCCYDDNAAVQSFSTAGYVQGYFCSLFGGSATKDARTDFYNRMFNFKDVPGYDESLNATHGWWDRRGDGRDAYETWAVNWNSILGNVQEETLLVGYTKECYEVELAVIGKDAADNDIYAYVLKSPLNIIDSNSAFEGVAWYENKIYAPTGESVSGYTLVRDDVWQLVGSVYEPVENVLLDVENDGRTPKIARLFDDPADNIIRFYYVAEVAPRSAAEVEPLSIDALSDVYGINATGGNNNGDNDGDNYGDNYGDNGGANYSDNGGGIVALSSDFSSMANTSALANWLGKHVPMSATGGVLTFISRSMNTEIHDVLALYPLKNINLKDGLTNVYDMIEGDVLEINGLEVEGFNSSLVPYFGFNQKYGHWVLVDANDNILTNSNIASLSVTPLTGRIILTAGSEEGTVYLKYLIDEDKYTSYTVPALSLNASLTKTAYAQINTTVKPFNGSLWANGRIIGYEGESLNLLSLLSSVGSPTVHVFDDTGKEIAAAVTWDKKYLNGLTINGNELFFDQESGDNDWIIWAEYRGTRSPDIPVKVLPAHSLSEITITDTKRFPPLLDDYILGDDADTFDVAQWLNINAKDQYGDDWSIDANDAHWFYEYALPDGGIMVDQLPNGILTVTAAGSYNIWAEKDGVMSNRLTLNVLPAPAVASITVTGNIPPLDVDPNRSSHTYDLSQLTVEALDQYGRIVNIPGAVWDIPNGAKYVAIENGVITGYATGEGVVRITYGGASSNEIPFSVGASAYIKELYYSDNADYVIEGAPYDLTKVFLTAKDQWGEPYTMTQNQIDGIVWQISGDPPGTIGAADITLRGTILEIEPGSVGYAGTGTVVLTAVLPDRGDGKATEALFVVLYVRQAAVPAKLMIGLVSDTELREGENALVSDFFTISALDQYDEAYPVTTDDVVWTSDNTSAFDFSLLNGQLAICAASENENADVTASIDVNKYGLDSNNYKNATLETVTSNAINLSVPMPRRVKSISVAGTPNVVGFGDTLNVNTLVSTVYDENNAPFTSDELAGYPATIRYSIDAGGTGSVFDASIGLISFGDNRGTVDLIAMAVNSSNAQLASTIVKIAVEPAIYTVTFNLDGGSRTGGGALTQIVPAGGAVVAPIVERKGYTFNGWNRSLTNINASMTVTAQWSGSGGGGGSGGGSGGSGGRGGGSGTNAIAAIAPEQTPTTIDEPELPLAAPITFAAFIVGFEDNTFRGDVLITREQFVTILFRLKNPRSLPEANKIAPSFNDVAPDRWSYDAVEWASGAGIAAADAFGNFRPDEALTRAEMAVMLVKADKLNEMAEDAFNDLDGHPDRDAILAAVAANIFTGYPDGSFKPDGNTTREEAVTALVRYLLGGEPVDEMWKNLRLSFSDVTKSQWAWKYIALAVNGYAGAAE